MKLKERNNSVFGMADTWLDYSFRCACVFIKIHKYVAQFTTTVNSKAQQS